MACRKDMKPKWNSTPAHRGSFPPPPPVRKGKHRPPDCFSPPAAKKQQKDEPQNWAKSPPPKQPLKVKVATKEAPSSPQPFSLLPRDPMDPFEKVRRWNDAGGDPRYLSLGSMGSLVACPSCGPDTVPLAPIEPRVSTRRDTMMHADVIGDFAGAEEAPPPLPHEVTLGISSLKKLMKGETHWEGRMSEEIEFCKVSSGSANSPKEVHTISPMSIEELPGPDPPAPAHPFGGAQAPPPPPALASAPAPAPVIAQIFAQAPAPSLSAPFVAPVPAEGLVPPAMPTFSKRAVCRHPHEVLVHTPVFLKLPMDPPPAAGPPCQNPPSPLAPALVLPPPPPPAPVEPVKPVEPAPVPPPSPLPAPASPAVIQVPASPVPGPAPEAQVAEVEALENGQPQSEPQPEPEPEPEPEPVAVPAPRPSSPVFVPPLSQGSSSRMSSQCLSQLEAGPKEDAKPDHITIRQRRLGQRPMRELKEYVQRSGIEVEAFKGKSDLVKKLADRSEEELPFFQDLFPPEAGKEVLALKWNRRLSLFCNFGE